MAQPKLFRPVICGTTTAQVNNIYIMKKFIIPVVILAMATTLSSCSAIAGIFKAGAAVGVIAVIIVIAIIIWILSMFRGRN